MVAPNWRGQPFARFAKPRNAWILAGFSAGGLLSDIPLDRRGRCEVSYFAILQPIFTVFLAYISHVAANESQLQSNLAQLLACVANVSSALLTDVASSVQLADVTELLAGEPQLQPGVPQLARWRPYIPIVLACFSYLVPNVPRGVLAYQPELPQKPRDSAVADQPKLLADVAVLFSSDSRPGIRWEPIVSQRLGLCA